MKNANVFSRVGNYFASTFKRFRNYLLDIKSEIKKVTWPTKSDLIKTSIAVLVISVIFGVYLQLVDVSFRAIVNKVIGIFR